MRITESALRRIIRQEVRALHEARPVRDPARPPNDYWQLYSTFAVSALTSRHYDDVENFKHEDPAAFKKFLKRLWKISDAGRDSYPHLGELVAAMEAAGVTPSKQLKKTAAKWATDVDEERAAPTGPAPKVRGTGPNVKLAQQALDMYYNNEHPDEIANFMISKTARRARGSQDVVSDRSDELLALIMAVDPVAGKELEETLDGFEFMG